MSHTPLFDSLSRTIRLAHECERRGLPTAEGLGLLASEARARRASPREALRGIARAGVGAGPGLHAADRAVAAGKATRNDGGAGAGELVQGDGAGVGAKATRDVAIVGAGLAGLACADELLRAGVKATLYEAADRVGGRCWSLTDTFPGQVVERGGELIDNLHKTMIGYARQLNLTLEDMGKVPGEVTYYFGNQRHEAAKVVEEYRQFVATLRGDMQKISLRVSAKNRTPDDERLDRTSLAEYLDGKNSSGQAAPPLVKAVLLQAYEAEYGLPAGEQSALNMLCFIHASKRSRFMPFGGSDERYHIMEGNDRIPLGLAERLPGQIQLGMRLVKMTRTAAGRIELTLQQGAKTVVKTHDQVVVTVPFSVLRSVELDPSLGLSGDKLTAIKEIGYGANVKTMVGFKARPWAVDGRNGASYSDLANHQATWETNPTRATPTHAVLTDYASAARGVRLDPANAQADAERFLSDLERVFPGAAAAATRLDGQMLVHMEHWPSNRGALGSYTGYKIGQFTTVAGHEGTSERNIYFAGEHTSSFHEWQGFMEGAAVSGIDAARALLRS